MTLWLLLAMEFAIIVYAGSRPNSHTILGAGVFVNMVLIVLFAPYLIEVGGLVTNIGTVFYASVVASMCVVIERFGPRVAKDAIPNTYIRLLIIFAACYAISLLPVVDGNEGFAAAAKIISRHNLIIVTASFAAFALSQIVLVIAYPKLRAHYGPAAAVAIGTVLCQAVDSPVFFGVAFYNQCPYSYMTLAVTGFLVKVLFGAVLYPAVLLAVHLGSVPERSHRPGLSKSVSAGR